MAHYMIQVSYTSDAVSDMVNNPQDRGAVVRALVEGLGGKIEAFYFAFGDHDVVVIAELPDNVTMAALSMAVGASGALKALKTTVLISMASSMEAMKKAGRIGYQPPGR